MLESLARRTQTLDLPGAFRGASGKIVGQGALLLAATAAVNGLNYLYHVVMGPLLGPERYGEFATLLGMLTIIGVPAGVVQMVVTQRVARQRALGRSADLAALSSPVLLPLLAYGSLTALTLTVFRETIARLFHLQSDLPLVVLALVFLLSLLVPLTFGALNGLQRFWALSVALVSSTLGRCISGIALVALGAGATGALAGSGFAALVVLATGALLVPAFFRLSRRSAAAVSIPDGRQAEPSGFPVDVLIGAAALSALIYTDVAAVKHFFAPDEAGQYAAAATMGKALLFLPGAISLLLLPKMSHRHALGERTTDGLRLAVGALMALCAPLLGLFLLAPTVPVQIAYGATYMPSAAYVGLYGLAMAGFATLQLLLWYYLAVGDRRFPFLLAGGAIVQAIAFLLFHRDPQQILAVLVATSAILLMASEAVCGGLRGTRVNRSFKPEHAISA